MEAEQSEKNAITYWESQGAALHNVAKTPRDTHWDSERMRKLSRASWFKRKGFRGPRYKLDRFNRDCQ